MTDLAGATPQHFDIGRVVQRTFGVVQRNFVVLLLLGLLLASLPGVVFGWAQFSLIGSAMGAVGRQVPNLGLLTGQALMLMVGGLVYLVGSFMLQAGAVHATLADLNGRPASFQDCVATGLRYFLPLLGITLLMAFALFFGLLLLVVPGVMMAMAWIVAIPAEVSERTGVLRAFSRSAALTRGHRWPIFALVIVYFIALFVVQMALLGISGGFTLATMGKPSWVTSIVITPLLQVVGIVGVVGAASIYYELRTIKEGVGPEALASVFD